MNSDNFNNDTNSKEDMDHYLADVPSLDDLMSAAGNMSDEQFNDLLSEMMEGDSELNEIVQSMDDISHCDMHMVAIPEELASSSYVGPIYGFWRSETGYHVIYCGEDKKAPTELGASLIGIIVSDECDVKRQLVDLDLNEGILGIRDKQGLKLYSIKDLALSQQPDNSSFLLDSVKEMQQEVFTFTKNLFSRNAGLLETNWMNEVCAVISGCGSVGSLVSLQLARSGVGRFILIDEDCVEIHNVCRHQCGLRDVGRRKVFAVKERILQINPNAEVICFPRKFQDVSWPYGKEEWLDPQRSVFIGTCDNRVGNAFVCDAAYENGIPFVALGFETRAWGGEIFTCIPEKHDICYRCAFKTQVEQSIAEERRSHDYVDDGEKGKISFEPGLDVDIEFGVSLFDKIVLDVINRNNKEYHPRIYHTLTQFTYFSGTDQKPDAFWRRALSAPISMANIELRDNLRRCPLCKMLTE